MSIIIITLGQEDLKELIDHHTLTIRDLSCKRYDNLIGIDLNISDPYPNIVEVLRCKDCKWYMTEAETKEDPYFEDAENVLGYEGFCRSWDKWTDEEDFCSRGSEKEG